MKNFHLLTLNLRSRRSGEAVRTIHFVWTRPNFWLWAGGFFLVRDIHYMFHGTYEELALLSGLAWSALVWWERKKLYAPYEDAWNVVAKEGGAP